MTTKKEFENKMLQNWYALQCQRKSDMLLKWQKLTIIVKKDAMSSVLFHIPLQIEFTVRFQNRSPWYIIPFDLFLQNCLHLAFFGLFVLMNQCVICVLDKIGQR